MITIYIYLYIFNIILKKKNRVWFRANKKCLNREIALNHVRLSLYEQNIIKFVPSEFHVRKGHFLNMNECTTTSNSTKKDDVC